MKGYCLSILSSSSSPWKGMGVTLYRMVDYPIIDSANFAYYLRIYDLTHRFFEEVFKLLDFLIRVGHLIDRFHLTLTRVFSMLGEGKWLIPKEPLRSPFLGIPSRVLQHIL